MDEGGRELPQGCPRKLKCQPLHRIESGDGGSFVCCGLRPPVYRRLVKKGSLDGIRDPYRLCFKNDDTDSMYDYDELDLLDEAEVILRGISTARRIV